MERQVQVPPFPFLTPTTSQRLCSLWELDSLWRSRENRGKTSWPSSGHESPRNCSRDYPIPGKLQTQFLKEGLFCNCTFGKGRRYSEDCGLNSGEQLPFWSVSHDSWSASSERPLGFMVHLKLSLIDMGKTVQSLACQDGWHYFSEPSWQGILLG